jgi:hypothetical protein
MSRLPDRPDLGQLRRQARELQRAAAAGDADSLRRLRTVSDKVTLSAAQLALAREHGFPSWRLLRDEVERRRATTQNPERSGSGPDTSVRPTSWREVTQWSARLLADRTGEDVAAWNRRVAQTGIADEPSLRAWLAERGVTGYAQALLVWERFGYPTCAATTTVSTSAGRSYAARATTATSAWSGATCPATARCGCFAGPSCGWPTPTRRSSRRPCGRAAGWWRGSVSPTPRAIRSAPASTRRT